MKLTQCKDLSSQSATVIEQLMKRGMTREQAMGVWCNSKTKAILEKQKIFWVSGMRCFVELEYELTNNPLWMSDTFD